MKWGIGVHTLEVLYNVKGKRNYGGLLDQGWLCAPGGM